MNSSAIGTMPFHNNNNHRFRKEYRLAIIAFLWVNLTTRPTRIEESWGVLGSFGASVLNTRRGQQRTNGLTKKGVEKNTLIPLYASSSMTDRPTNEDAATIVTPNHHDPHARRRKVAIIGAGWGGLSAAQCLADANSKNNEKQYTSSNNNLVDVTVYEASPRVGGLVRDGYTTIAGTRPAEAGQHGFWQNYHNIYRHFRRLQERENNGTASIAAAALTDFTEQGQYSPQGLQAIWPVYRDQPVNLPTGLAQAMYARFLHLSWSDLLSASPLMLALLEFDDSAAAWNRYDQVSFRDLCQRLGVSRKCYQEAFEPMILTGLFAPGAECSAAAALGMAYFFVLQSQTAFDVQWCRGNIGTVVMDPWIEKLTQAGVTIQCNTRVTGFQLGIDNRRVTNLVVSTFDPNTNTTTTSVEEVDDVIFAVGAKALNAFVRFCPELAQFPEFRGFANLRGTSVLATRIFLDRHVTVPYSANACWGFDEGVGMTLFDIGALHGTDAPTVANCSGSVLEIDYYHASTLLVRSDDDLVKKVKSDLDVILGPECSVASVVDAAIVRLPEAVNWYFPGSYKDMPDLQSNSVRNIYFAGDIVRTRHGSWSQEKAFVTGKQAANILLGRPMDQGVLPVASDEVHVQLGRAVIAGFRSLAASKGMHLSLADFSRT